MKTEEMKLSGTAFIRVLSDNGKYENKAFEHLTREEMLRAVGLDTTERAILWCDYLAEKVRWYEQFLITEGYEIAED